MDNLLGESPAFRKLLSISDEYAKTSWPVLILGETGVGKELIAQRIHEKSERSQRPFFPVNIATLVSGLFESELFGYERGAFTGALQSSRGIARQCDGGTLFLDELGELSLVSQVKLLRFLDHQEIRSVGSQRVEKVNIRILAATNRDLYAAVVEGSFRRDLLERLSVLVLEVPPLRIRREDIIPLGMYFFRLAGIHVEAELLLPFMEHPWPGNIRQLRNVCLRTAVLYKQNITPKVVEQALERERILNFGSRQESLEEIERKAILERLRRCHGNRKQAAKELGIAKSTLQEKLRQWRELQNADSLKDVGNQVIV